MAGDPWHTRRATALARWVIARDKGICWRCGHPGADTAGHVLPRKTHPELMFDPDNLRAEHGRRRTLERDGFDCVGNYAADNHAGRRGRRRTERPVARRDWLG